MYKRLSLDEVLTIQTSFFERLSTLCTKNRFDHFKPFLTEFTEDAQRVYFFRENALAFTFYPLPDQGLRISDELDHLDIILTADEVNRLHSLLKDKKTMKHAKDQKSVFDDLLGRFREG